LSSASPAVLSFRRHRLASVSTSPPDRPRNSSPDHALWFAAEVHSHESSLKAYLRTAFPAVRDVEDVMQESFLRVWKARAVGPINSAKAFLFTVARRLALNTLRRERRSPIVAVTDLSRLFALDDGPDAAALAATHQEIELLVDAVSLLPARCREIFVLRRLQGVPQKEIAERLGLSEQTVQVQASRGLHRVSQYLRNRVNSLE